MHVLVAAASEHGSTAEIASAIGEALEERGMFVTVAPVEDVQSVDGYDAFVIGSAVYAGHWLKRAREFVEHHARALSARPVWLFSSGPIGNPPIPKEAAVDVQPLATAVHARHHRVFGGKLDRSTLGFAEKAICTALRAPEGDFRDFTEIRGWALGIAESLRKDPAAV
jgi:menaquinone-dependent protoporphyrinogen oxidase